MLPVRRDSYRETPLSHCNCSGDVVAVSSRPQSIHGVSPPAIGGAHSRPSSPCPSPLFSQSISTEKQSPISLADECCLPVQLPVWLSDDDGDDDDDCFSIFYFSSLSVGCVEGNGSCPWCADVAAMVFGSPGNGSATDASTLVSLPPRALRVKKKVECLKSGGMATVVDSAPKLLSGTNYAW